MSMVMQWVQVSAAEAARIVAMGADAFDDWLEGEALHARSIDLDKAWHGVHYALTGAVGEDGGELAGVTFGGEEFGEDLGYGPARWLPPEDVARLADALDAMTPATFATRVDLAAMARDGVYPGVWDRDEEADGLRRWLVAGFITIRAGFATSRDAGDGFVVSLL